MIPGTQGADTLLGTADSDVLFGYRGDDLILGGAGLDFVYGGQGADTVFGGQGADFLLGNLGNDLMFGNIGNDVLYGGQGNDTLYGGQGDDTLYGDLGDNVLSGDAGSDTAVFWGRRSSYTVTQNQDGSVTLVGSSGTTQAASIENFRFDDVTLTASEILQAPPAEPHMLGDVKYVFAVGRSAESSKPSSYNDYVAFDVTDAVEVNNLNSGDDGNVDFSPNSITVNFTRSGSFGDGLLFFGPSITDNQNFYKDFSTASLLYSDVSGFGREDVDGNGDRLGLNLTGISFDAGDRIVITVAPSA